MAYLTRALAESDWSHSEICGLFERKFEEFLGVGHAMLVPSGTAAVYLALTAAGIQSGQEVIVPGITWPSVIYAIVKAGGIPRVVDISLDSLCITTEDVDAAINDKTFAVLATHIFGSQCDMASLCRLAELRDILVIEDAAQSIGSRQSDKSCGTWGLVGAFSFNDRKVLACGEGGCVVTNSDLVYEELRRLQLILPERDSQPASLPGTYKVSEFQAAVALGQLEQLEAKLARMETGAQRLSQVLLPALPVLQQQSQPASVTRQSYFNYCFHLAGVNTIDFATQLSARIGLRVAQLYKPLCDITDFLPLASRAEVAAGGLFTRQKNCETAYRYRSLRLPHTVLMADSATLVDLGNTMLETLENVGGAK